ncbi:acyl carrier protein [uncultured Thomasclavelia sp.]|uniref:acyl carrier protein n=1 Tax=uncultured Thomasclavelia sp. TaxID=3025759 RepID=UPI0025FC2626|nr:acyl carrier protein [uncultured Thomasclavelia sp.]
MDKLLEILEDLLPGEDLENNERLVDNHILDSLTILSLVAEIEDEFDVTVPAVAIVPANFNSVKAIYTMIMSLQEDN